GAVGEVAALADQVELVPGTAGGAVEEGLLPSIHDVLVLVEVGARADLEEIERGREDVVVEFVVVEGVDDLVHAGDRGAAFGAPAMGRGSRAGRRREALRSTSSARSLARPSKAVSRSPARSAAMRRRRVASGSAVTFSMRRRRTPPSMSFWRSVMSWRRRAGRP